MRLLVEEPSLAPNGQGVLVSRAVHLPISFRAVVADAFYGEDRGFRQGLRNPKVGYVLALGPSHAWWHPETEIGSFQEAAQEAGWECAERPGRWVKVTRTFRDGSSQDWWALELDIRPFGPDKQERVIVAMTDPATVESHKVVPVPFSSSLTKSCRSRCECCNHPWFALTRLSQLVQSCPLFALPLKLLVSRDGSVSSKTRGLRTVGTKNRNTE
jgi:hypothetical protein